MVYITSTVGWMLSSHQVPVLQSITLRLNEVDMHMLSKLLQAVGPTLFDLWLDLEISNYYLPAGESSLCWYIGTKLNNQQKSSQKINFFHNCALHLLQLNTSGSAPTVNNFLPSLLSQITLPHFNEFTLSIFNYTILEWMSLTGIISTKFFCDPHFAAADWVIHFDKDCLPLARAIHKAEITCLWCSWNPSVPCLIA